MKGKVNSGIKGLEVLQKRRVFILFIDKIKLFKFYGVSLSVVVCAFALIFMPLRLPVSRRLIYPIDSFKS